VPSEEDIAEATASDVPAYLILIFDHLIHDNYRRLIGALKFVLVKSESNLAAYCLQA
jgi:hypothetical protein